MNTLAKIALGTVATGAVVLAAMTPVMAAPQTPGVDMSVATPTAISATAPAYLASTPVPQEPAPAAATHTATPGEFNVSGYVAHAATQSVGQQTASRFGCGIFTNSAANQLKDH